MSRRLHVEVRELMRQARRWVDAIKDHCVPPSLTYYDAQDGKGKRYQVGLAGTRTRAQIRPDEYLENDIAQLSNVSLYARGVIMQAMKVHELAERRIKELEAGK